MLLLNTLQQQQLAWYSPRADAGEEDKRKILFIYEFARGY